jgi:Phage capsid family
MTILAEEALRRIRHLAQAIEPDSRWQQLCREVDPARMVRDVMSEQLTGAGREASEELRLRFPNGPTESRVRIPWETLAYRSARYQATRADLVANLSTGGYLVPTLNYTSAAQALMSMLVLGKLGATSISSVGPLNLPRVTGTPTPFWLSTEQTSITETDTTFGQVAYSPHMIGGYTEISRLLALQSMPDAGDVVANDLARKVGRSIEAAAFAGTGTAGQPHGLAGMANVNAVSGAAYALATGMTAATSTGDALTDDANPGWAANRNVASLLRQRQEFAGSSLTLWRGPLTWGTLHDFVAGSTSGVAASTAFFGNWKYLVVVDFAGGLAIDTNPYDQGNFQKGIVGLRCMATIDVAPVWPAAFTAVTGIT